MRQLRNLTSTTSAALAALMLLAACTNDDAQAKPGSAPAERERATTPTSDYTILGVPHQYGPGRWGVTAIGDPDAPVAVFDVPEGFQGRESWVWTDNQGPRQFAQLASWRPKRVPRDPCDAKASSPSLGPTVADFAAALAAQKRTTTTKPIPVVLDGHEGLYVELTSPTRFDYQACGPDGMEIWEAGVGGPRGLDGPSTDRYWIMDVDGYRVVISAMTLRSATRETVELVTGVVETVAFVDPQ